MKISELIELLGDYDTSKDIRVVADDHSYEVGGIYNVKPGELYLMLDDRNVQVFP